MVDLRLSRLWLRFESQLLHYCSDHLLPHLQLMDTRDPYATSLQSVTTASQPPPNPPSSSLSSSLPPSPYRHFIPLLQATHRLCGLIPPIFVTTHTTEEN